MDDFTPMATNWALKDRAIKRHFHKIAKMREGEAAAAAIRRHTRQAKASRTRPARAARLTVPPPAASSGADGGRRAGGGVVDRAAAAARAGGRHARAAARLRRRQLTDHDYRRTDAKRRSLRGGGLD